MKAVRFIMYTDLEKIMRIHLRIKFRAFLFTIMTLDREFYVNLPASVPQLPEQVLFNERGVYLAVRI